MLKKDNYLLTVSLLTLLVFLILFIFRASDDNGLTSWQWVFGETGATTVFLVLLFGVIFIGMFSGVSWPLGRPAIFLFLLSFITGVFFWSEPEVIVDSSRYFTQAKHLEIYGLSYFVREWGRDIPAWTDMPLVPFLFGLIFSVAGEVRLYIQVFTTVLFSLSVVLTYMVGKELWDRDTGLYAGVLLLGFPYLLTQVPLMLVDVPTMFFLTLSVYACIRASRGREVWTIAFAGISISLAFFSKYSTWPMLSILLLVFLVRGHREGGLSGRDYLRRVILVIGVSLLVIGAVVAVKFDVILQQIRLLITYQRPGLERWGESFASIYFYQMHPFVTILALFSTWVAFRRRDKRFAIISWLVVLALAFHLKRIRYILPLFPMIALMASYGLQRIREGEVRRFIVLCIVLSSLTVGVLAYLPFTLGMSAANLKNAGAFLDGLDTESVEVFTSHSKEPVVNPAVAVPLLDLYTEKRIVYRCESSVLRPKEDVETSPLRFTWEYRNPRYYTEGPAVEDGKSPVVVIAGDLDEVFPLYVSRKTRDYQAVRVFIDDEGVFQFKTFVAVYRRPGPAIN